MTMTAMTAMQALLDGETVYCHNDGDLHKFKLADGGELLWWSTSYASWSPVPWLLNNIEGVYEEYSLTFREALKAMLDGKIVESENSKCKYLLADVCGVAFAEVTEGEPRDRILITTIKVPDQIGKWKVVG